MSDRKGSPRFTSRPSPDDLPEVWKILRATAHGTPDCLILSDDTTGAYVHYWGGRTQPCLYDCCHICFKGQQARWRGYLPVITAKVKQLRLLEITPSVVPPIDRWIKERSTLRGLVISLERKGRKPNGELVATIREAAGFAPDLPNGPNVGLVLARIWRLTHDPLASESRADGQRSARPDAGAERMASPNGKPGGRSGQF